MSGACLKGSGRHSFVYLDKGPAPCPCSLVNLNDESAKLQLYALKQGAQGGACARSLLERSIYVF